MGTGADITTSAKLWFMVRTAEEEGVHDLGAESARRKMGKTLIPPLANPLVCPLVGTFINAEDTLSTPLCLGACFASSSNPVFFSLERVSHPVSSADPHLMDFLAKAAVTSKLAAAGLWP